MGLYTVLIGARGFNHLDMFIREKLTMLNKDASLFLQFTAYSSP